MNETNAPIPYADVDRDDESREVLERPLPATLDELRRYAAGDETFAPPHWVRLRASRDARVGGKVLEAWRVLTPLVEGYAGADRKALAEAFAELELDASDATVQAFAATALERKVAPGAESVLFATASHGVGERYDALFARGDAPASAHILRLAALRDFGGMPWSDAFANAIAPALPNLGKDAASWVVRFIAELTDGRARAFLAAQATSASDERLRADIARILASPPAAAAERDDEEVLPDAMDKLELGAIDPRKPARRPRYLGRIADRDWGRARRLASSITTDDWRLDEVVGALLNHASHQVMADDFRTRGLVTKDVRLPADDPSARALLRKAGRVVRFDTVSMDGVIDHDALAYKLADAAGDALFGVDFLEESEDERTLILHAWDGATHYAAELDTRRSVVDPYGLVGLLNVIMRDRGRPERGLLAAEDKAVCDVILGPEKPLRELVEGGLLWIRSGFKW